jgi:hypothetical protein
MHDLEQLWQSQPVEPVTLDLTRKAPVGDWARPTQARPLLLPVAALAVALAALLALWVVWPPHRLVGSPVEPLVFTEALRDAGARPMAVPSEVYLRGKALADRRDFRTACLVWKSAHSRSDLDLLRALTNICTRRAAEIANRREAGCDELKVAFDFAVDGDRFAAALEARRRELHCSP